MPARVAVEPVRLPRPTRLMRGELLHQPEQRVDGLLRAADHTVDDRPGLTDLMLEKLLNDRGKSECHYWPPNWASIASRGD